MQLTITFLFELIALICSIAFYLKKRHKLILWFMSFLLLTVLIEFTGWWLTIHHGKWKYAMYNIFTPIEFLFYAFLFYVHLKKLKVLILVFYPFFIIATIFNTLFIQGINSTFNTYIFLLGSFCMVVFCCTYYYESVLPEKVDQQLSKQPFFWIVSGLLINYLGSVIINALFQYLTSNDLQVEGRRIYTIINNTLNVILYSSFCIAFFLCPNNKKTSLSQS
jgi:hypothetical protein